MGWMTGKAGPALVAVVLAWAAASLAAGPAGYEVLSQTDTEITFKVTLPSFKLDTLSYEGVEYVRPFAMELVSFAEQGRPDLPAFSVLLALPEGADPRLVSVSPAGGGSIDGVRAAPVPEMGSTGEGENRFPLSLYVEDENVYGGTAAFPAQAAWLTDRGTLRHQDVVRVLISPFRFLPGEARLVYSKEFTVTVAFGGGGGRSGGAVGEDTWEGVYKGTLLNYDQGKRWRKTAVRRKIQGAPAPTAANGRVKILIDETGIHRVGYDMLASVGFPTDVPVDEIMVYRDEFGEGSPDPVQAVESAIVVADNDANGVFSAGDTVSFYALDFYDQFGRRGGEDYFFDKNVYWLSWGTGPHARMLSRSGWREGVSPTVPEHFTDLVHREEDVSFVGYPANDNMDFYTWQRHSASLSFDLPGVDSLSPASLITKFVSYYYSPKGKPLSGRILMYIASCTTPQTQVASYTVSVPSVDQRTTPIAPGMLCSRGNTFRFESQLSAYDSPGHQLDWFEVAYSRKYQAYENKLTFDNGGVTGEVEFRIGDFTCADIRVYDVTDSIAPVRIEIDPGQIEEDGGSFTLALRDSIGARRRYLAFCESGALVPGAEAVSFAGPPSLREATAQYLIVSHPDFAGDLGRLIARRRDQGLSVLLATTDEVYDDFGNGMKSDVAIRRFAEYAYHNGDAQFLLLVGDANTDRRGVLLGPAGGGTPSDVDYVPSHNFIGTDGGSNKEIRPYENWFALLDGSDDIYPDIYVGRFPVDNVEELAGMIGKIETFEDYAGANPWKKRLLLVSDDFYYQPEGQSVLCRTSSDFAFERGCDSVAVIARDYAVVAPDTVRYYLRRCTDGHEPELRALGLCVDLASAQLYTRTHCTPELKSLFNSGALVVNYQGHSNRNVLTHENLIQDSQYYNDILGLTNSGSPFIFLGLGCWMADFQRQSEGATFIGEALAEKFVKNEHGGACLSFTSAYAEPISQNEDYNPYLIRAFFTHLQGRDPQGAPIPARILAGEAAVTSLIRYGSFAHIRRQIFLGDPAMVVDMGPPAVEVTAGGVPVDESFVYTGSDTLDIVADLRDEEAIMSIDLDTVEGDVVTPVPADAYTSEALVDLDFTRSRAYEVTYRHKPLLGDYEVRLACEDYSGKSSSVAVRIETGSAAFFRDSQELKDGDPLVFGQTLRVEVTRPVAVAEADILVDVDGTAASEFAGYDIQMLDGQGKRWAVSFRPSLEQGDHTVTVSVQGLSAGRDFEYVPGRINVYADDKILYDNDYVQPAAEFEVMVEAAAGVTEADLGIKLDGEDVPAAFEPDSSGAVFTASFGVDLDPGSHTIAVRVLEGWVSTSFQVSDELALTDVSVFPSPFSRETYFYYTLSEDARKVSLDIYTVSGRLIFEGDLPTTTGYNQYRWDGRDTASDRIANGTYYYRLVATNGSREREATGWVVKIE